MNLIRLNLVLWSTGEPTWQQLWLMTSAPSAIPWVHHCITVAWMQRAPLIILSHDDLLAKLIDVIPDNSWLVLHYWYLHMGVQIRWGTHLSDNIPVTCGIRQGGLISPLAFNIFYEQLICKLQSNSHGVTIKGLHFNTFCYADDILICSTSVTGLQELINIATSYIVSHGLKFNPKKTSCYIMG